jgi:hypothetical protein
LASYREAFRPSGAKDHPSDAELLCQLVSLHPGQLRPWHPDDELTRKLALLCEKRRQAVEARTALSNQLKSELKQYYPLALAVLENDLTTALAADFLLQWPNFESLKNLKKLRPTSCVSSFMAITAGASKNSKSGWNASRLLKP